MRGFWLKLRSPPSSARRPRGGARVSPRDGAGQRQPDSARECVAHHRAVAGSLAVLAPRESLARRDLWRAIDGAKPRARSLTALLSFGLGIGVNAVVFSLAVELLLESAQRHRRVVGGLGAPRRQQPRAAGRARRARTQRHLSGRRRRQRRDARELRQWGRHAACLRGGDHEELFHCSGHSARTGPRLPPDDPDDVVVLGDRFWRRHFNADPAIVGSQIRLEGRPFTVVGILPRDPSNTDRIRPRARGLRSALPGRHDARHVCAPEAGVDSGRGPRAREERRRPNQRGRPARGWTTPSACTWRRQQDSIACRKRPI